MNREEPAESNEMRLNRHLAQKGIATRREADELIAQGRVYVNGSRAQIGMKVTPTDTVEVRSKKPRGMDRLYVAYFKPRGIITHSPQRGEADIVSTLPAELRGKGLFPVGRLDKDSYGLIILTNDGRVTDRLLNPLSTHEKEYAVRVKHPLRKSFKEHLEKGIDIEGYMTKPAKVRVTGESSFSITLTEGKKHQIRRMVVAMFNEVVDLKRTRVLNIKIGQLKSGEARVIESSERTEFLTLLGLPVD